MRLLYCLRESVDIVSMRTNQQICIKPKPRGKTIPHPQHDLVNLIAKKLVLRETGKFVEALSQ